MAGPRIGRWRWGHAHARLAICCCALATVGCLNPPPPTAPFGQVYTPGPVTIQPGVPAATIPSPPTGSAQPAVPFQPSMPGPAAPAPALPTPAAPVAPVIPTVPAPAAPPLAVQPESGVTLTPSQVAAPIGSNVILVAGVVGPDRRPVPYERVDWSLAPGGVGQISLLGELPAGLASSLRPRSQFIDPSHATTTTFPSGERLSRGTGNPLDDVTIASGQTWISVTSFSEGTTQVTAAAPAMQNPATRQQAATIQWLDAQWSAPPAATNSAGTKRQLTTTVTRRSSNAPLVGWLVRYEITGGPEAGFPPDNTRAIEVLTDSSGKATAEIAETQPVGGINTISVQVIRPEGFVPGSRRLVFGAATIQTTWTGTAMPAPQTLLPGNPQPAPGPATAPQPAPQPPAASPAAIELRLNGPDHADVGSDVRFELEVINKGGSPANGLVLTDAFDDGLVHAVSKSPIQRELLTLAPNTSQKINVSFKVAKAGQLCHTIDVTGPGGIHETKQACLTATEPTPPAKPNVSVTITGPPTVQAGQMAEFTIEVKNTGDADAVNLKLTDTFDDKALSVSRATPGFVRYGNQLVLSIDRLAKGASQGAKIEFGTPAPAAKTCQQVTVTDGSAVNASAQGCLEIQPAGAAAAAGTLNLTAATLANPVKVGGNTSFLITVTNNGPNPAKNITLSAVVPDSMQYVEAPTSNPTKATADGQKISFAPILQMAPGEKQTFEIQVHALQAGDATLQAQVTSDSVTKPLTANATTHIFAEQ